jgi:hypothetical protein
VWRTDHGFSDTLAEQAQTQALSPWVPETMGYETHSQSNPWRRPGPYTTPEALYRMRLGYDAGFGVNPGWPGVENAEWIAWIKQAIAEYREVQPYIYGDFYALLPYSVGEEAWTAWQWDRPEQGDGLAIVLRRPGSPFTSMQLGLRHVDLAAQYLVEVRPTYDKVAPLTMKGSDLAHLEVKLEAAPASLLVFYRRQ